MLAIFNLHQEFPDENIGCYCLSYSPHQKKFNKSKLTIAAEQALMAAKFRLS